MQRRKSGSGSRKSSAYDPLFEQNLIDHGVFPHGYDLEVESASAFPGNLDHINAKLRLPRPSLSPSKFGHAEFRRFEKANLSAQTETGVMNTAFRTIVGESDIPNQQNVKFNNLAPLTDGNITQDQPDFYDGARPADVHPQVRKQLSRYVVPSTNTSNPCVPNFFAEGKGPRGNAAVCKRQACYDGGLGARAVHELRTYADPETAFDNNAYTISSTYSGGAGGGFLTLYATHPTPSESRQRQAEYHMTQLRSYAVTDQPESFREGAGALRNARDWAYENRQELIAAANAKAQSVRSDPPRHVRASANEQKQAAVVRANEISRYGNGEASAISTSHSSLPSSDVSGAAIHESDTSPDELALDLNPPAKRASRNTKLSPQSNQKRRTSAGPRFSAGRSTPAMAASTAMRTIHRDSMPSRDVAADSTPSSSQAAMWNKAALSNAKRHPEAARLYGMAYRYSATHPALAAQYAAHVRRLVASAQADHARVRSQREEDEEEDDEE